MSRLTQTYLKPENLVYACTFLAVFPYSIPFQICIALTCLATLFNKNTKNCIWLTPGVVFILVCLLSALWSENQGRSIELAYRLLPLIVLPFIILNAPVNKKIFGNILLAFVLGVFFTILLGYALQTHDSLYNEPNKYLSLITKTKFNYFFHHMVLELRYHHIYLSLNCALAGLASMALAIKDYKSAFPKTLLFLLGAFILVHPILFQSRFIIVAMLLIAGVFMLKYRIFFILTSVVLVATFGMYYINPELFHRFEHFSLNNARISFWQSLWVLIETKPLLGYGLGDMNSKIMGVLKEVTEEASRRKMDAHNQFIQILIGAGAIGFIAQMAYIVMPLYLSRKKLFKSRIVGLYSLILCVLLFESFLFREKGIATFALFYGLFLMEYKLQNKSELQ